MMMTSLPRVQLDFSTDWIWSLEEQITERAPVRSFQREVKLVRVFSLKVSVCEICL